MAFFKEFKDFAMRGNLVDIAVAFVSAFVFVSEFAFVFASEIGPDF